MWRMKLMRLNFACFLMVQLLVQSNLHAQKRWDGEGRDSLWNNTLNWHPNGIPTTGDTVVLDNQWVHSNYHVYLPDSLTTSYAHSVRIQPSSAYRINLIIPSTNTAAPALSLSTLDTAIHIDNGGSLLNFSGASAGNPIAIAGKFKIKNGGRYLHQTLRGNALLITNLVSDTETRKGIFEFNVPGNSAYTISASGRTFGSLVLSGLNPARKTYTASGINKLTIEGDLIINEQAGFSSNLTNTVSVRGNLIIKGRLLMNPASGDTLGRSLESSGHNQIISITGLFNQGIHFREWIINGKYTILNSSVTLEQTNSSIHFQTGSDIDMGTSMIKGIGRVIIDSNTNIATAARTIIGADSMSNIQIAQLDIHQAVRFTCYGENIQSTGGKFPLIISSLQLKKSNARLFLTKSLQIKDSLLLNKGIIEIAKDATITINNYTDLGNDSSFVVGSIIQRSKKYQLHFPLGVDSFYAPISIIRNTDSVSSYTITPRLFSSIDTAQFTIPPVEKITSKFYWAITKLDTTIEYVQVRIPLRNNQLEKFSCIAELDTTENKWNLVQKIINTSESNYLLSNHISLANRVFAVGRLQQQALPLNNISLKKMNTRNQMILRWTVNDDENAKYYLIEQSKDGRYFKQKDSIPSLKHRGEAIYVKQIERESISTTLYRIIGVDIDMNKYASNIVYDQSPQSAIAIYPNPSNDEIQIRTKEKILNCKIIHSNGKTSSIQYKKEGNNAIISVRHLSAGKYFLMITLAKGLETIAFMKQ